MMNTLLGLDLSRNFSLFTVPAIYLCSFAAHTYALCLAPQHYDPANPRSYMDALEKSESIPKAKQQRVKRALSTSQNILETLGFYAGAIVAASVAGVAAPTVNLLALFQLVGRVFYCVSYIFLQDNRQLAPLRSLIWMALQTSTIVLWTKAGFAMMRN